MLIIPLQPVPSQSISPTLNGQAVKLNVYQVSTGLYIDVFLNDVPVIVGVLCWDADPIVREAYLGFDGDLAFFDTQASDPPDYTGLGTRWVLAYLQ